MPEFWRELSTQRPWLENVLEIVLMVLGAWLVRQFGMGWLRAKARRAGLGNQVLAVLDRALIPTLLLAVLAASLNLFRLPVKLLAVLNRILYVGFLGVLLYYGSQAMQILLNQWLARKEGSEAMREPTRFLARTLFAIFGILILLENLGISLTTVWTTIGVGSVAVALALQDTLSNFFAGVYVHIDRPVRLGDYAKLASGEEGYIVEMGWRSTRLRTLSNNIVIVPNSKLATTSITNYSLPEPGMSLSISVRVSRDSDPEKIEHLLLDEATQATGTINGLLPDPAPSVRFIPGFGESSLDFSLDCCVGSYVDQYFVQHELRKRILGRLRREGVEMPFPQRDVHLSTDFYGAPDGLRLPSANHSSNR